MSEDNVKHTSDYSPISDNDGDNALVKMEQSDESWQAVLNEMKIFPVDFANWVEDSPARIARFTKIRSKDLGEKQ